MQGENQPETTSGGSGDGTNGTEAGSGVGRRGFLGGVSALLAGTAFSLEVPKATAAQVRNERGEATQTLTSPDGGVSVTVDVSDGSPTYSVAHDGRTVVEPSGLGFEFQNQPTFGSGLEVTGTERSSYDESWTPVWDQYEEIREHYEALRIGLRETSDPGRAMTLELRAFDDGVGFRYVFPEDGGFGDFVVTSERTGFAFGGDYTSWWIENDFNSYEYEYKRTPLSEVGSGTSYDGAHTPITMKADDDSYVSVHEASLVDYASMAVEPVSEGSTTFESTLAPYPDGKKVTASAPHRTPWRTVQVADRPGALAESNLVVNLNESFDEAAFPQGTDWIVPKKFIGVWWLMITGRADWEYTGPRSGNHGAQTDRMKRYMSFASEHGIPSVLVEGWNEGWDSYPGDGSTMDFDDPYPDFDWDEVISHGESLDPPVEMTAHNETAGNISNYEAQLDDDPNPFDDYDSRGIRSIKTGYVADSGVTIDGETFNHHCQPLVNHHRLVYRKAAANRQMLEVHEPIKPTGERRTYPNVMTREGVYGQEYDSFGFVSPSHHVTFPFTRMLGGPVEYTPGIFDMDSGSGGIETTRAKQLAMYPTYFSGLQMVADLPSSYLADRPATLGVGEVAQAEFAEVDGFPTATRWADAQGGRYVAFDPNRADTGAATTWTVEDVPEAGEYDVFLRYASDAEDNAVDAGTPRTATVRADGSSSQVTLAPTPYWDEWRTVSTRVTLSAGENTVSVTLAEGDTGGFNLDSVALRPATAGVGDVVQAENGTLDGFPTASRWEDAQGGEYVPVDPNRADAGATASWTVEAAAAGDYTLQLRYASDAEENAVPADTARTATVTVGETSTQVTAEPTEFWDVWETLSVPVSLSAGENTVSVTLAEGDTGGFNLDAVAVTEGDAFPDQPTVPEMDPTLGPTVDAFQFVEDVPAAGWDDTRVLDAAIGDYSVFAREKDDEWYVGAMTDENGRALDVPLDFLAPGQGPPDDAGGGPPDDNPGQGPPDDNPGKGNGNGNAGGGPPDDDPGQGPPESVPRGPKYVLELYSDGIEASFDDNLTDMRVDEAIVAPNSTVLASMVGSGGTAMRLRPASESEVEELPAYGRPEQEIDVTVAAETFVQEPFITATGRNTGDYIGGTTVELVVDGDVVASENVRIAPGSSGEFEFSYAIDDPGTYDIVVRSTGGETLASETVTVKPPTVVADLTDPDGDDDGPGEYTYPTDGAFREGAFDLRSVVVEQTPSIYRFTFEVDSLYNAFGSSRGFSPQLFGLWVRDPSAEGGSTAALDDLGLNATFAEAWQYRLEISGFTKSAVDAAGAPLTDAEGDTVSLRESVDTEVGTVAVSLPREAFGGVDAADLEIVAMVQSEDRGTLRPVELRNAAFAFGGAKEGAVGSAPLIQDLLTPSGEQADALAYSAGEPATLPFVPLGGE
jgi:hypothetical protein